jgi:hypothetical protein
MVQSSRNLSDEFRAASERDHIAAEFFLTAGHARFLFSPSAIFVEKRRESFRARFIVVK